VVAAAAAVVAAAAAVVAAAAAAAADAGDRELKGSGGVCSIRAQAPDPLRRPSLLG
jgi:hypothetical protein